MSPPTCVTGEGRRSEGHVPKKVTFRSDEFLGDTTRRSHSMRVSPGLLSRRLEEDGEPYQQLRNFEALVACPKWCRFPCVTLQCMYVSKLSAHTLRPRISVQSDRCWRREKQRKGTQKKRAQEQ